MASYGLPSKPLAAAISGRHPSLELACARAGIVPRDEYRWRMGETRPTAYSADKILTKLGLHWWDVWNEDTVREYVFTVTSYRFEIKKDGRGIKRRRRVVTRTREYVDIGTDYYELRRIQRIMEGEHAREAA